MKIDILPYQLIFQVGARQPRTGALLKVTFAEGKVGFADCHPWENLGDPPLQEQIALLKEGKQTSLTARSLHFARLDAEARKKGVPLLQSLSVPLSHYLVLDMRTINVEEVLEQGYTRLKIKLGENLEEESKLLKALLKKIDKALLRLDFNLRLTKAQFETFLQSFKDHLHQIEFCEDPFPYHPSEWREIQQRYNISLACDHRSEKAIGHEESAAVLVVKPAVQDEAPFLQVSKQKIVITSYLDHPVGQMGAAYVAGQIYRALPKQVIVCGLLSHHAYKPTAFSRELSKQGPNFKLPAGTGFGWDTLLEDIE